MPKRTSITPSKTSKSVRPMDRANELMHESLETYYELKRGKISPEQAKVMAINLRNAERVIEDELAERRIEIYLQRETRKTLEFGAKYRPASSVNGVLPAPKKPQPATKEQETKDA